VPLLVSDYNPVDGNLDSAYVLDTADTTYAQKEVATLSQQINLGESIDNFFFDVYGTGLIVDTGSIFTYSNGMSIYLTASDTEGDDESIASAPTIDLSDATNPTVVQFEDITGVPAVITDLAGLVANSTITVRCTQSEDWPYAAASTYVAIQGVNADLSIANETWAGNNIIVFDITLALGGLQTTGTGVLISLEDTNGNTSTDTLVFP